MHNLKKSDGFAGPQVQFGRYRSENSAINGIRSLQLSIEKTVPATETLRGANNLLSQIPIEDLERIGPLLEPVQFSKFEELHNVGYGDTYIHFPVDAVVSQLSIFKDGSTAEIALIGNEGMVGLNHIFNAGSSERLISIVVAGGALRMRAKEMRKEFERGGAFQTLVLAYAGHYLEQVSQRAVCNLQHKIEERFASWLLMLDDRIGSNLSLTQDQISCRLGTRRASITLAAISLQKQKIISCSRGRICILDRETLEAAACECYKTFNRKKSIANDDRIS